MNLESNTYYLSSSNEKIDNSFTLIRLAIYPCCEVRNCYDLNFQSKMLFLKRLLWQLRDLHKYNVFLNFESNHVNYIVIAWNFDKILLKNQWREKFRSYFWSTYFRNIPPFLNVDTNFSVLSMFWYKCTFVELATEKGDECLAYSWNSACFGRMEWAWVWYRRCRYDLQHWQSLGSNDSSWISASKSHLFQNQILMVPQEV